MTLHRLGAKIKDIGELVWVAVSRMGGRSAAFRKVCRGYVQLYSWQPRRNGANYLAVNAELSPSARVALIAATI